MTATTVILSGPMRKRFGRQFHLHLDGKSPREACRALAAVLPGFRDYLLKAKARGIEFAIWRGRGKDAENIGVEQLDEPAGATIRIAPVVVGSKRAGVLQTIIGIVLIVVSFWTGGSTLSIGIAMVAGGVVQMLTPVPKLNKSADSAGNQSSYIFNGPINTSAQGGCVPVAYGRVRVGSAVISAGMIAEDYSSATSNIGSGTPGGNWKKTPFDDD
jgi:predicted phage tail protein